MQLDPKLAQAIVNKMMNSIPYNINIMNEEGYIIASGDKNRLNTLHIAAKDIIKSGKTKPMIESFGIYGQPGINIPLEFDGQIIGVIGITGDPEKVTPLAALLKISTELMISQINNTKVENQHQETLNHFLYQWTNADDVLQNEELRVRAHFLGIDPSLPRFVVIIETNDLKKTTIRKEDFYYRKSYDQQLIITESENQLKKYITFCQENKFNIGISNKGYNLKKAVKQASDTITVSQELQLKDVYHFKQISFLNHLLKSNLYSTRALSIFKSFQKTKSGTELLETLDIYFKNGGNVTETSQILKVHRNTTNYRLNKIAEIFGLNLHDLTDVLQLYTNYLHFKKYLYTHK